MHPQKGTGECRPRPASQEALAQETGSTRGTRNLCKDSPGHQQGRPPNGWVFSCPGCGRGRDGEPAPISDQAQSRLGRQGFRHQKKPKVDPGLCFAPESSCSFSVSKCKASTKDFLIWVPWWPVKMQIHGHHPVNSGPSELAHSRVCPVMEAALIWEPL